MIRIGTLIWFALAALAGYAMFEIKYEVVALEEKLALRNQEILSHQESIHILRAEWTYLTDPARLADLAERHLTLHPVAATDMVSVETIHVMTAAAETSAR